MTDQQYSFIEAVKEFQYHLNRCNEIINRYFRYGEQSIEPPTGMYSSNSPAPSSYEGEGYGDGYSPTSPSYIPPPPSPKGDQILLDSSTTPKSDQTLLDTPKSDQDSTTPKSDQTLLDFTTQSFSTTNDPPVINHHFEKNCCRRSASPKYILVNSPGHYSNMMMYRHAEPPPRGIYLPPPSYEGEGEYSTPSYIPPPPPQSKQTLSPTVHFGKNCCREHRLANPNYIVYNSPGHSAANRYSPYHHFVNGHYSSMH